jgi:hypothetical protein
MTADNATAAPPRDGAQRKRDVLRRLTQDEDAWVATSSADGVPYLVPLSFAWLGRTLVMATKAVNPTVVHVRATGRAVISLGHTRDVVLIKTDAWAVPADELPAQEAEAFAAKLGWDPSARKGWSYLRFRPRTVRAWREENELAGRLLMTGGTWRV